MSVAFSLKVHPRRLDIASDDIITTIAAAGDLLWIGTQLGRLIRYDTIAADTSEIQSRNGVGKMACAIWRLSADPYSRSALVILSNADVYYAASTGPVRVRWLTKLRGLRCVSATWLRVPASAVQTRSGPKGEDPVILALLGTAFGSIFAVTIDLKNERDDLIRKVWSAPSGERIDGIRVERVAGNYVGTIATSSVLYMLFGANTLDDLFSSVEGDAVHRLGDLSSASVDSRRTGDSETTPKVSEANLPLPSELQFMSSTAGGGVASRRFVWAAHGGILHAQLALRSRRMKELKTSSQSTTISASVTEKAVISWQTLKEKSGSAAPIACNLSTFHILVLYPGSIYAYNQISGELTQRLDVWHPEFEENGCSELLHAPAAGFVRDCLVDSLWIFTHDGQLARVVTEEGELRDAWRAAKAVGRFDLAMALAPLISGEENMSADSVSSREAVIEAQADHAAANGDWDAAARLYAKTNRPVEAVLIDIFEAGAREGSEGTSFSNLLGKNLMDAQDQSGNHDAGWTQEDALAYCEQSSVVPYTEPSPPSKFMIIYLVCKLDTIPDNRPSQRTIIATLLVELYASSLARLASNNDRSETGQLSAMKDDFRNFLVDHVKDLHVPTAVSILTSHCCYQPARTVSVLAGDYQRAGELCLLHGDVEEALALLDLPGLSGKDKDTAELLESMSGSLATVSPGRLAHAWATAAKKGNKYLNHRSLLMCLSRVARSNEGAEAAAAYRAAMLYIHDVLCGVPLGEDGNIIHRESGDHQEYIGALETLSPEWHRTIRLLFVLHAECGNYSDAQNSYVTLVEPHDKDGSQEMMETLGDILLSGYRGKFWGLIVRVYGALGLHEEAVALALERKGEEGAGAAAAREHVVAVSSGLKSRSRVRGLWMQLAASDDDALSVAQQSGGVLRVDDALPLMKDFTRADPHVTAAVAASLAEHQEAAAAAAAEASETLERTVAIRKDIATAMSWKESAAGQLGNISFSAWSGHDSIETADRPL